MWGILSGRSEYHSVLGGTPVSPMYFISIQQPCSDGPGRSILVTKDKGLQEYLGEV